MRINALRAGLFAAASVLIVYTILIAPGWPYVAVGIPAQDPLRDVRQPSTPSLTVPLHARCLAAVVRPDGVFVAALPAADGRLSFVAVWPDGRTARAETNLGGEPSLVAGAATAFFAWVPAPPPATSGGKLYALPVSRLGLETSANITPLWQRSLERTVLRMMSVPGAIALLTSDSSGIPDDCSVLSANDGRLLWQDPVPEGLWTSWAAAALAGGVALGGAAAGDGGLQALVRVRNAGGDVLYEDNTGEGPPYVLGLSPTGRFLLGVTHKRLHLWISEGAEQWSRAFPAVSVLGVAVSPEGRVVLGTGQNILAVDTRGRVTRRWRGPALAAYAVGGAGGGLLCVLNGGAAVVSPDGELAAALRWDGQTQALAVDPERGRLWRVGEAALELFAFPGP